VYYIYMKPSTITLQICLSVTLIIALFAAPGFSQSPGFTRSTQNLRTGYDDCLRRAETALTSEGYRIDDRNEGWRGGTKGSMRAEIVCSQAPGNATWANVVVVGNSNARAALDNERAVLQQRLEGTVATAPVSGPVSATTANLAGRWAWVATCRDSTPSGRLEILAARQAGTFTGNFANTNNADTGTIIDGRQQGLLIEFRRQIPGVGEQRWTGGVERSGRGLRMEGRIDGPGGPCTFSATSETMGAAPRAAGGSTTITGTWNWTASCRGSRPSGRFEITTQRRDGTIAGAFSNTTPSDTGTIDGRQQGLLVDFRRQVPGAGEQQWTGGLAANGGVLTMEGRIDGSGGPCTFSATLTR
jgi:hypothetical protein